MDVLEHLTKEHREVERMLGRLQQSEPGEQREQLVAELAQSLSTHMAVEERFLYATVAKVLDEEHRTEAQNEHELTREGLRKLKELVAEPGFGGAVEMLKAGIRHHVEEEEQEVFPALRQKAADELSLLDPEELEHEVQDSSSGRSSGEEPTKEELYEKARQAGIEGRSTMTKDELSEALESQRA